jgi:TPR repeat protein
VLGRPTARVAYARVLAENGEHRRAFQQFARAARRGLPAAQFWLGRCYLLGLGTPSSPDTALRWLTCAAEADDVEAQALLASLALQGISVGADGGLLEAASRFAGRPPDYQAAMKWGRRAAAAGSAEAQTMLGYILTYGPDELRDVPRATRYYRDAAESGFARGQLGWALALLGDNGAQDGTSQDGALQDAVSLGEAAQDRSSEVRRLLQAAAQADLPAAHFVLGVLDELAGGDAEQLATAAAHYHEAAGQGHRAAQFRYGVALMTGRGVERNALHGETWLRRAGLAGDRDAAAMVGDLYSSQDEVPPNFCEAAMWFQRAAEAGHIGAARALGQLCVRGGGFGTDPVAAAHWLRVAATEGDTVAAYELGICLAHGIGTPRDDAEALGWFRRAIDTMPEARYWCARMLAEGRGTAQDLPAARADFLLAAAEGIGDAAVVAGEMLVNGRGGPPDRPAAMALFHAAAAQGNRAAQYALEVLEPNAPTAAMDNPVPAPTGGARVSGGACVAACSPVA